MQRLFENNAAAIGLGKSLRESGVNAMFMGDRNHNSDNISDSMSLTAAAFKPDIMFVEAQSSSTDAFGKYVGAEVVPIDPWSNEKKEHFYDLQGKQGEALDRNRLYAEKYDEAMKSGDSKQALEHLKVMEGSKQEYGELYKQTSEMLKERMGDSVNEGMAENMANKIEEHYKETGKMPRFTFEGGAGHIEGRNDVDEMVMKKLEERGLPTQEYENHKEVEFKDSKKGDEVEVNKKIFSEFEYGVSVPAGQIPDQRGAEPQSQGYNSGR